MASLVNPYKVRFDSYDQGRSTTPRQSVVFEVMPTISQSHSVEYQAFDPVHSPSSYYVYRGTKAVTFEISAKFVSRTTQEATTNLGYLNILRGWTRGYFGYGTASGGNRGDTSGGLNSSYFNAPNATTSQSVQPLTQSSLMGQFQQPSTASNVSGTTMTGTMTSPNNTAQGNGVLSNAQTTSYVQSYLSNMNSNQVNATNAVSTSSNSTNTQSSSSGKALLGAPPEVLYLSAYSNATNSNPGGQTTQQGSSGILNKQTNITQVPCVITALSYMYPNDVDYIPTIQGQPFPIVMDISISVVESHSPQELEYFDIFKYRAGALPGF